MHSPDIDMNTEQPQFLPDLMLCHWSGNIYLKIAFIYPHSKYPRNVCSNAVHTGFGATSPAPGHPFVTLATGNPYGPYFPQPGRATCAMPPPICEKSTYRSLDGSCNHLEQPQLGMANSRYARLLPPRYGDGISSPTVSVTGEELPSARLVSLVVFGEMDVPDPEFTLINMQWGQIITHDMSMQAGGTQSSKFPTMAGY